jgi:hypothetical protein
MPISVLLMDVDGTLVNGLGEYNHALMEAIRIARKAYADLQIVLFTSYEWISLLPKAERGLTRDIVMQELSHHEIPVTAVIMTHSSQAEHEPAAFGHYYKEVFQPIEKLMESVRDKAKLEGILARYPDAQHQEAAYKSSAPKRTINTRAQGANDNKEPMFRYVLAHYDDPGTLFLIVDDSAAVLAAADHLRETEGYPLQRLLTTVQAGMATTQSYLHAFATAFNWPLAPLDAALPPSGPALPAAKPTFPVSKNVESATYKKLSFFKNLLAPKSTLSTTPPNTSTAPTEQPSRSPSCSR